MRIEGVAQAIAKEVESQDSQSDHHPRGNGDMGEFGDKGAAIGQDAPPGWIRRLNTQTQK